MVILLFPGICRVVENPRSSGKWNIFLSKPQVFCSLNRVMATDQQCIVAAADGAYDYLCINTNFGLVKDHILTVLKLF